MRVSPRPGVGRAASSGGKGEGKQNAGRKDRQQRGGGGMHGTVPELEALHFPPQAADPGAGTVASAQINWKAVGRVSTT